MKFITKRNIIVIAGMFAVIVFMLFFSNNVFVDSNEYETITVTDGWTLIVNDNEYHDKKFSQLSEYIEDTDAITIQFTLGDISSIADPIIGFRSNHEAVTVKINDETVYSYGQQYYDDKQFISSMYNYIDLAGGKKGDIVTINLRTYHYKAALPDKVIIGNVNDITQNFIQSRRSIMYTGLFMCIFGILVIALIPVMIFFEEKNFSLVYCGMFSILLGGYILSYSDVLLVFMPKVLEAGMVEFVTFFIGPVVFNLIMMSLVEEYDRLKKTNIILALIGAVMFALACILQIFKIKLFYEVTIYFQVVILLECVFSIFEIITLIKNRDREKSDYVGYASVFIRAIGVAMFIVMIVVDIIYAIVVYFVFETGISTRKPYFTVAGSIIFIICVMLSYVFSAIDHLNAGTIRRSLEELAYTDNLTLVANRAKCSAVMDSVDENDDMQYTVIAIDMDNLKSMNDAFGHEYGDNKIRKLSDMMLRIFSKDAFLIGRMGGDEFIIMLQGTDRSKCNGLLENLLEIINSYNTESKTRIPLQISCGCAYSDEHDFAHCYEAYNMADERMYKMKIQHHIAAGKEDANEN